MDACISTATLALAPFLVKELIPLVIEYFGDYKTGDQIYVKKGLFRKWGISYKNFPLFFWVAGYYPEEEMLRVISMLTEIGPGKWIPSGPFVSKPREVLIPQFRFGCVAAHDSFIDIYVCPEKLKSGGHIEVL
jgi:hypothetical protein